MSRQLEHMKINYNLDVDISSACLLILSYDCSRREESEKTNIVKYFNSFSFVYVDFFSTIQAN